MTVRVYSKFEAKFVHVNKQKLAGETLVYTNTRCVTALYGCSGLVTNRCIEQEGHMYNAKVLHMNPFFSRHQLVAYTWSVKFMVT